MLSFLKGTTHIQYSEFGVRKEFHRKTLTVSNFLLTFLKG